jgi:hypothetical protein
MKTRTVLRRRHAAAPVTVRTAGWVTAGLLLASAGLGPAAHAAAAASVQPTPIDTGNDTCADLAPAGSSWQQFKLEAGQLADGTYTDGTITVTISNFADSSSGTAGSFDWTADQGVDAVFVKAGSSRHNLYVYDPEATSDEGLGPQAGRGNGISHILFCYDEGEAAAETASQSADPDPSDDPSSVPSDDPSSAPSDDPGSHASDDPGAVQTDPPSASPSDDPSSAPSDDPGSQASDDPGAVQTDPPSASPSDDPGAVQTDPPVDGGIGDEAHASNDPSDSPTGAVLGATSGPVVTAPPTDTLGETETHGSAVESWRIIAAGLALIIVSLLLVPARPARGRVRN